jgi:beta-lactamase family protein
MITHRRTFLKQLGLGMGSVGLVSSFPRTVLAASGGAGKLPRSTPEAQGVHSEGILEFLRAIEGTKHEFHSFMMLRHGQVVAEGWWSPYRAELNHMLYSLSKSFTSSSVGLAIAEKQLTVEDPVISFFPDKLPREVSTNLRALKIKHLLTMSVGHAQDSTPSITKEDDWVKTFLSLPIANPPGTAFLYNSGATYMLSAIVQKVTGQKVIDFLKPRLFEPLGIQDMTWETCPRGINTGGWGLSVRTEALAKFGQMYLQKGAWHGRQVLPTAWVEEATSFKIQQPGADLEKLKRESDWHQGYCYQFWRCRHNAFRGDGAFGQYTIVMPEQDVVIAITSESPNMQGEMNLIWEHLWPAIEAGPVAQNKHAAEELHEKLHNLSLGVPRGQASCATASRVSGKRFKIQPNEAEVQNVSFHFNKHECLFNLTDARGVYPINCGLEKWLAGQTSMPGTPPKLTMSSGITRSQVAASGTWQDEQTFAMTWRFIETPHHDTVTCRFDGDTVKLTFLNSVTQLSPSHKETRPVLVGQLG